MRLPSPAAHRTLAVLTDGLEEAEFDLSGHVVVDVAVAGEPLHQSDGSITLSLEALTLVAD